MSTAQKRKYLTYTLATGWLCLFIILLLSGSVLTSFINGNSASGTVVDKQVYIEQIRETGSPRQSELHEITVQYKVAGETYQIYANAHIYAGMGLIEEGDNLTVVYSPGNPAQAQVLSYALYSPMVSILGYVTFVCFLVGFPRWLLWRNKPIKDEK